MAVPGGLLSFQEGAYLTALLSGDPGRTCLETGAGQEVRAPPVAHGESPSQGAGDGDRPPPGTTQQGLSRAAAARAAPASLEGQACCPPALFTLAREASRKATSSAPVPQSPWFLRSGW